MSDINIENFSDSTNSLVVKNVEESKEKNCKSVDSGDLDLQDEFLDDHDDFYLLTFMNNQESFLTS